MRSVTIIATMFLACISTPAATSELEIGTPEQRREAIAACGRDARLYCSSVKEEDGAFAYLACLKSNRSRLTARCGILLTQYGQ